MTMTRWQRIKRRIRIAWQGECSREGCEAAVIAAPFHSSRLCEEHYAERWKEAAREMHQQAFEREVEIHAEALRRVNAEKERNLCRWPQTRRASWTPRRNRSSV